MKQSILESNGLKRSVTIIEHKTEIVDGGVNNVITKGSMQGKQITQSDDK
jgi:hypothetical protein